MPTYFKEKGYRFFFVSYDCIEPRHVHVVKDGKECKFWASSEKRIILEDNKGFRAPDITFVQNAIEANYQLIKKIWDEHCKDTAPKAYK
jgi:hypothetical protein